MFRYYVAPDRCAVVGDRDRFLAELYLPFNTSITIGMSGKYEADNNNQVLGLLLQPIVQKLLMAPALPVL
jgi:hypothetical protein